jgi:hypothetical protein
MDRKKARIFIDKINHIYSSIESDEEVHKIEKDLLKSYVQSLYEAISSDEEKPSAKPPVTKAKKVVAKEPKSELVTESKPSFGVEYVEDEAVEIIEEKEQVVAAPAKPIPVPTKTTIKPELAALFGDQLVAAELSDKLRMMPIKDLAGSMSINEKIFTIQELFGGDKDEYNSALSKLDSFSSFKEAKEYLMAGSAEKYKWYEEGKLKKAEHFIQLVHRRYS